MDRRTSLTYPKGMVSSYDYDKAYRLTGANCPGGTREPSPTIRWGNRVSQLTEQGTTRARQGRFEDRYAA